MTEISGKVAVVTGGGSGIGLGLSMALAEEGARVVVADILKERAEAVAVEIKKKGGSAIAVVCDVSDRAAVQKMKDDANRAFGKVLLLFANAGATSFERLAEPPPDHDIDWIVQVNLMGVINCLTTFLPDMVAARDGHVVGTSSTAGLFPTFMPYHPLYAAAKMGILALMLNVRIELSESNVGSTAYCPGGVQTAMKGAWRYRPARFGGPLEQDVAVPDFFKHWKVDAYPPERIAPMVLQAVKKNRAIVLDHSGDQREIFKTSYVDYVEQAFDDVEAYDRELAKKTK